MAAKKVIQSAMVAVAAVSVMSVSTPAQAKNSNQAQNGRQEAAFRTLEQAQMGPWTTEMAVICRSAEEWQREMGTMMAAGSLMGMPEAPRVDWNSKAVILVTMGQQTSAGHMIEVTGVERHGHTVIVAVKKTHAAGGLRRQTMTAPFHMVEVEARGTKTLRVEENWESQGIAATASGISTSSDGAEQEVSWGSIKQNYLPR